MAEWCRFPQIPISKYTHHKRIAYVVFGKQKITRDPIGVETGSIGTSFLLFTMFSLCLWRICGVVNNGIWQDYHNVGYE